MSSTALDIIFENDTFLAINKPAGQLSIPDRAQSEPSLKDMLINKYGVIYTVHRLDKDTSGLILFAKNDHTHRFLSRMFEEREVEKYYTGIVIGSPNEKEGLIDAPISEHPVNKGMMVVHRNGKPSTTGFTVLEAYKQYSLLRFRLYTGRTHQIRVHAKNIGHSLACDPLYGDGKPVLLSSFKKKFKLGKFEEEKPMINRLALHSYQLVFTDELGTKHELTAPVPKEFRALMQQLKKLS